MHVLEDVNPSLLQKKGGQRIESDACVVNHTCVALGGIACLADGMFFLTEISILLNPYNLPRFFSHIFAAEFLCPGL